MARLPYPDPSTVAAAMRDLPERLRATNVGRMLAHAPAVVPPYYAFSAALLSQLELDPRLRQIAILRVTHRTGARYAWTQHVALARIVGVREEQLAALQRNAIEAGRFSPREQLCWP